MHLLSSFQIIISFPNLLSLASALKVSENQCLVWLYKGTGQVYHSAVLFSLKHLFRTPVHDMRLTALSSIWCLSCSPPTSMKLLCAPEHHHAGAELEFQRRESVILKHTKIIYTACLVWGGTTFGRDGHLLYVIQTCLQTWTHIQIWWWWWWWLGSMISQTCRFPWEWAGKQLSNPLYKQWVWIVL